MSEKGRADAFSLTVPAYLEAVRAMHGLGVSEVASALRVSPSVVRRWERGTLVPTWRRLRRMAELWGGSPEMLALGAALQRFSRDTKLEIGDAVRMIKSGRRNAPERRAVRRVDRRQLDLPMGG